MLTSTPLRKALFLILFVLLFGSLTAASPAVSEEEKVQFGFYEGYKGPQYKGIVVHSSYVAMHDGTRLAVDLILPKNLSSAEKIPAIIKQTRYWRAVEYRQPASWFKGPDQSEKFFAENGYAVVLVDVRGSGASFGTRPHPWSWDEVMDGDEIVEWIISQPWSNGRVGSIGISYSGTAAEFIAATNHPALKAVIPQFADHDVYKDIAFPGGIRLDWFIKNWAYYNHLLDFNIVPKEAGFLGRLLVKGVKPVDGKDGFRLLEQAVREHSANQNVYDLAMSATYRDDRDANGITIDEFSPHAFRSEIERSGVGIFSWGSWMDETQADAVIRRFLTYTNPQHAVIGPWSHGGDHHASPYLDANTPTDPPLQGQWLECLRFFDYYLKGTDNGIMKEKTLIYYTMGEEKWKKTNVWPPKGSTRQRWYFEKDGALSKDAPAEESGSDTYTIDFDATTGSTNRWHTQMGGDVIYPDRTPQDRIMLTYTSSPLPGPLEITGHPVVTLQITSTHDDGAFFVYLEDVDENGRSTYITEGHLRALHRKISSDAPPHTMLTPYHSYKKKDGAPLVSGELANLTFELHPTSVLIQKGHRIRIAIAGHDKDTFARIPAEGTPTITVARNRTAASFIDLPVIRQ